MPIYEYECPKCGVVEVTQSISDAPLTKCPTCRRKVKRLISLNNFHLKGSGWYATDYAKKSNGGNGKANGKSHTETKESKETTTSKTTEATETKKTESPTTSTGTHA